MKKAIKIILPLFLLAFISSQIVAKEVTPIIKGVYIVQKGDCLWTIAAKKNIFGSSWQWPLFLDYNKSLISNPNRLEVGTALAIPGQMSFKQIDHAVKFARIFPGPNENKAVPAFVVFASKSIAAAPIHEEAAPGFQSWMAAVAAGILLIVIAFIGLARFYRARPEVPAAMPAMPPEPLAQETQAQPAPVPPMEKIEPVPPRPETAVFPVPESDTPEKKHQDAA